MRVSLRNVLPVTLVPILSQPLPGVSADQIAWTPEQQEIIDLMQDGPIGLEENFAEWAARYHPDWSYWELGTDNIRPHDEHMDRVRNYIESGARVVEFDLQPVYVAVRGETALIRFKAVEKIVEPGGDTIDVRFSSASVLLKEDEEWKLFATNIYYPPDAQAAEN